MSQRSPSPPPVHSLGYIGLGVRDLGAWEQYVNDILGFEWGPALDDGARLVRMDARRQRLIVAATGEDDITFAGWEVRDAAALLELERHLSGLGVKTTRGTPGWVAARGVEQLIAFEDCDGFATEVFCGPAVETRRPFQASQPVAGFRTGELGLGHIVLTVPDEGRSETFYRDALGLRTTDYIHLDLAPGFRTRATFMRCNPRHHSVAFVKAPPPKRLLHFMAEVECLDEVGRARDRARQTGVRIAADLGRHTNDRMLSFYMESPSGFEVEYGCSGRLIDEAQWSLEVYDKAEIWGHERG
jgi:2,3-dihydroxybiphenyl 1,2-dioxygenase